MTAKTRTLACLLFLNLIRSLVYMIKKTENMACSSGCCGTPTVPEQATSSTGNRGSANSPPDIDSDHQSIKTEREDSCCSDCGDDAGSLTGDAFNLVEEPAVSGGQDGCCGGQAKEPANAAPPSAARDCNDSCCSAAPPSKKTDEPTESGTPECCHGTTSPGCDDSCLDRLALLACEGEKKAVHIVESYEGMFQLTSSA